MDIKGWDFVDPRITKRLLDLERTRSTLQQQHANLSSNNRLHCELKDKLIQQTKKVESKLSSMLHREKQQLVDYFDRQTIVVNNHKGHEKVPRLPIREDESTVEHSKIVDQLKTSVSTRRARRDHVLVQQCSVGQFSIREGQQLQRRKDSPAVKGNYASVSNGRVIRLKRKVKRQSAAIAILKHRRSNRHSLLSDSSQEQEQVEPCSASDIQLADYLEELQEYRIREEENNEYIDLLKKKMKATAEHYEQREADLQEQLADCARRLTRLTTDHARLEKLECENEALRLERAQLLRLFKLG